MSAYSQWSQFSLAASETSREQILLRERRVRSLCWLSVLMVAVLSSSGCGKSDSVTADVSTNDSKMMDELFTELDVPAADPAAAKGPAVPVVPIAKAAPGGRLELRLETGDRFPLVKTIEQSLVQKPAEFAASAQTRLELHMTIQVSQTASDAILMSVRYSRVMYDHDVNGHRMAYDSDQHQGAVPQDIIPYAGMVNNGFSFWLGRDNVIRELVDYDQFLERCVSQVSLERRQGLLAEISARFGDDGVANFVDDAIGLLPYDKTVDPESASKVSPGDVWTRERHLMLPVPVYMTSTCRLVSLNSQTAEIDITGRIAPGETYHDVRGDQSARVKIKGGQSFGSCTVDCATGLPLELKRTRYLQLSVASEGGPTVEQDKRVITTIRAFPTARGPVVQTSLAPQQNITAAGFSVSGSSANQGSLPFSHQPVPGQMSGQITGQNSAPVNGHILPVHGQQIPNQYPADRIPVNTPPGSTTRAVYPN